MTRKKISFSEAFWYWFKLGFINFGGPAGQIATMHQNLVQEKLWISNKRFMHALNFCMLLPGPEAQQLATYLGFLMHRTWGGIIAGLFFILPSFFILVGLGTIYMLYGKVNMIAGIFYGIKPAIVAIVFFSAFKIAQRTIHHATLLIISLLSFISIFSFHVPFPLIVLSAGIIGYVLNHFTPSLFQPEKIKLTNKKNTRIAIINDNSPIPRHAQFNINYFLKILISGILLIGFGIITLSYFFGFNHLLTQTALFFTKAALLTFGGAYAVLPYVYQGVVDHYQWVEPTQMIDGLALGESTPGPLIMVITFISFISGWSQNVFSAHSLFFSGFVTALIATIFTFLPSFMMIFLGTPFIESTRKVIKFHAPLTAISAAIIGVIFNLGVFFAYNVFWKNGVFNQSNYASFIILILSFIALIKFKTNTITIILLSGFIGLISIYI